MGCIYETESCESYANCPACSHYMDGELFEVHSTESDETDEGEER